MSGTIPDFSPAANSAPAPTPTTGEKIPDFSAAANGQQQSNDTVLDTVAHGAGQVATGINQGIAGLLGAPVDLLTGGANLIGRGVNAALGTDIQPLPAMPGGSESIKHLMGYVGANPDQNRPVSTSDRILQAIGTNAAGFAVPALGAEALLSRGVAAASPVARGVLNTLRGGGDMPATAAQTAKNTTAIGALGVPAGVGQVAGEDLAPSGHEALGGFAGAMLGAGMGALGTAGVRAGAAKIAGEPVADQAVRQFTDAMTDPHQTLGKIARGETPTLDGYQPTTANAVNDTGLLQLQNWARNRRPDLFNQRAAANNEKQVSALNTIAPPPDAVTPPVDIVRSRLADIDAQQASIEAAARAHAEKTLGDLGGTESPGIYGAEGQQAIRQNYEPAIGAAQSAEDAARARLVEGIQELGGQPAKDGQFDTLRQQYGSLLRNAVEQGRAARAAQEDALWAPINRSGMKFDPVPTQQAVAIARADINPAGGDIITPAESRLYGVIDQWNGPQPVNNIKTMRTNISDAANVAFRAGDTAAGRRLLGVRSGLDASMDAAIDARVAADQAAVAAGTLDPTQALGATLLRESHQWMASPPGQRSTAGVASGEPGVGGGAGAAVSPDAMRGVSPVAGEAAQRRAGATGNPELVGSPGEDIAGQYARARAFTRETHRIFDDTPAGKALERGPYGQPNANPDSQIAGNFWNAKNSAPEAIRNFEEATGGSTKAKALLQDYAAHDLLAKSYAPATGTLNPKAYADWLKNHAAALDAYPELRAKFGTVRAAQQQVTALQAGRAALEDSFRKALGDAADTSMARYFRAGPAGDQAMANYLRETGASPGGIEAMTNYMAADLRAKAARSGEMNPAVYRNWIATHRPALERLDAAHPGTLDRFNTAAAAQQTLADTAAARQQATKDFQTGAARFWLNSEPETAVTNVLSKRAGNDPAANIDAMMKLTANDPAARDGVKRAIVDWLMKKGQSGKEAGDTGTDYLRIQKMQDLINDNRKALAKAFTPQEMRTLDAVAESLKMSDRGISGSKAPIGPGTARDLIANAAMRGEPITALQAIRSGLMRVAAFGAGHVAGGVGGGVLGIVARDAGSGVMQALRAARTEQVHDLITAMILHPEIARTLTTRVTPQNFDAIGRRLARQLAVATATQGARYLDHKEKQ